MKQKKDTRHVKGIVESLLRKWEDGKRRRGSAVLAAWATAVGEAGKSHAKPVSLKNGMLMVIAENSTWLYKLTMEKKNILEKFNRSYEGRNKAKDIRFRIGDLSS